MRSETLSRELSASALQDLRSRQTASKQNAGSESAAENKGTALPEANLRQNILDEIEDVLPRDSKAASGAMATVAVGLSIAYPEPEALGRSIVSLQAELFELEQTQSRVTQATAIH